MNNETKVIHLELTPPILQEEAIQGKASEDSVWEAAGGI